MSIVLVAPPYYEVPPPDYGGTEIVVGELADALIERGHRVTVIGIGSRRGAADFVAVHGDGAADHLGAAFPEVVHTIEVRRAVELLAQSEKIDIVHDHTMAGPLNASTFLGMNIPTVVTVHCPANTELYRFYAALGEDAELVAVSARQRALAPDLRWSGTVHHGLRVDDWPYRTQKGGFALFLGRFCAEKGVHLALEAAHEADVPLVIAGTCVEGPDAAYFQEFVQPRLTVRDRVIGPLGPSDKRRILAAARCLLFPIEWEEPFGLVMIEAMACGTPVVALAAGSVPEVVQHGNTGFICQGVPELAESIRAAGSIEPAVCRQHVLDSFHSKRMAAEYEGIYRRASARSRQ
ncbi:glycosyltransferase family 4 protein [Nocardia takedensis]|uniref:glycosyltransferase family 4 protein n=1 Tax=Nocardia takedensis TaxID=259390 RepID=UPI003F768041